jgi:hypothetical protein
MKALSIMQPWITLIMTGEKSIEVRSRNTSYRGDVLLCSSKAPGLTKEGMREFEKDYGVSCLYGHALCVARLVDSRPLREGDEDAAFVETVDPSAYGWVLESIRPVVPFPVKGKLGFYEVDDHLVNISSFALGSSVRVRADVDDRELGLAIRGRQGWVVDYEASEDGCWSFGVMLDSLALREIPVSYLESCVADEVIWHTFWLEDGEIDAAEPQDTFEETWAAIEEIEGQHPTLFPEAEEE